MLDMGYCLMSSTAVLNPLQQPSRHAGRAADQGRTVVMASYQNFNRPVQLYPSGFVYRAFSHRYIPWSPHFLLGWAFL